MKLTRSAAICLLLAVPIIAEDSGPKKKADAPVIPDKTRIEIRTAEAQAWQARAQLAEAQILFDRLSRAYAEKLAEAERACGGSGKLDAATLICRPPEEKQP